MRSVLPPKNPQVYRLFFQHPILDGWRPISGLLTFLRLGTQMNSDTIGDPFVQLENPLSTSLMDGRIWAGSEGASFSFDVIKRQFMPESTNLSIPGGNVGRDPCRVTISPIEQFLSCSYILDFVGRHIRHEMNQQHRPSQLQVYNIKLHVQGVIFFAPVLDFCTIYKNVTCYLEYF
jgi:hypothetical protein